MTQPTRENTPPARRGGFTLVELLVVIVIIMLLMGILVPTVRSILNTAQQTEAKARIQSLSRSIDLWYKENNNRYPGQVNPAPLDNNSTTGSQLLAEALFTKIEDDGEEVFPASTKYADFTDDILIDYKLDGQTHENCISDGFPTPMPLLYFPARIGAAGNGSAYKASDNNELVNDDTKGGNFSNVSGSGGSRRYLLVGAGEDRQFYTADDITNIRVGG
jgi:prepilin-type N-terminal cleavage/methylation domain-containing protein